MGVRVGGGSVVSLPDSVDDEGSIGPFIDESDTDGEVGSPQLSGPPLPCFHAAEDLQGRLLLRSGRGRFGGPDNGEEALDWQVGEQPSADVVQVILLPERHDGMAALAASVLHKARLLGVVLAPVIPVNFHLVAARTTTHKTPERVRGLRPTIPLGSRRGGSLGESRIQNCRRVLRTRVDRSVRQQIRQLLLRPSTARRGQNPLVVEPSGDCHQRRAVSVHREDQLDGLGLLGVDLQNPNGFFVVQQQALAPIPDQARSAVANSAGFRRRAPTDRVPSPLGSFISVLLSTSSTKLALRGVASTSSCNQRRSP